MGCPCSTSDPSQYLNCSGGTVRLIAPSSVMMQYAAGAGASSANYTMCLTMAFLAARRMQYWKVQPGDCASPGTAVLGSTPKIEAGVLAGLRTGAAVDPEPISKGILAGVAAIFGGFTAHHAQAVATEQSTICAVTNAFNYTMDQLEAAVSSGQLSAANATAILDNSFSQTNPALNTIKKGQNAAWGYQIAMTALRNFAEGVVFPALESLAMGQVPTATPSVGAPPATSNYPVPYTPPPVTPTNPLGNLVGSFQGASGYTPTPLTGQNMGIGPTNPLPFSITPGTLLLLGGTVFVASRI